MNKYDSEFSALKALAYSVGVTTPQGGWDSSYSIIASMYEHLVGAPVEAGVMPIDMLGEIQRGAENGEIVISDNCINEIERLNSVVNELEKQLETAIPMTSLFKQVGYDNESAEFGVDVFELEIEKQKKKASEWMGSQNDWDYWGSDMIIAPYVDTSTCTSAIGTFNGNTKLLCIPKYDTSNITRWMDTFAGCYSLREIPLLDTSKAETFIYVFGNSGIERIPPLDFHNVTNCRMLFDNNECIKEIPELDFTNMQNANDFLWNAINVKTMGGFLNAKCNLAIFSCYYLDKESLMNVINKLGDVRELGGRTLTLGQMHIDMLSEAELQIAIDKGWNISLP